MESLKGIKAAETLLAESLSLLPPLSFSRRLITAVVAPTTATEAPATSNYLGATDKVVSSGIYGSVTELDVLQGMKEFGVVLDEGLGAFEEGPSIEKGRVKGVGKFNCEYTLPLFMLICGWALTHLE